MQPCSIVKRKYEICGYWGICIASLLISCVEPAIDDEGSVEGAGSSSSNGSINMMFDPLPMNNGTTDSMESGSEAGFESRGGISIVEDPMAGGSMDGGSMAGGSMDGGSMAGGSMAGEPAPTQMFPDYAIEMLEYVNDFRRTGGQCGAQSFPSAQPLRLQVLLNQAALAHAEDMARNNYFAHNSQDGRSPWDRIGATGYAGQAFGENIAAGRGDALSTFQQWRDSPGHCSNMLNGTFTELGVGYTNISMSMYRHYWVQNFARPR